MHLKAQQPACLGSTTNYRAGGIKSQGGESNGGSSSDDPESQDLSGGESLGQPLPDCVFSSLDIIGLTNLLLKFSGTILSAGLFCWISV